MSDESGADFWECTPEEWEDLQQIDECHRRDLRIQTATFFDISWHCEEPIFKQALNNFLDQLSGLEGHRNKHLTFLSVLVIQCLRNIENDCNQTIVFPRGNDYWGSNCFNPNKIGRTIVKFVDALIDGGYFVQDARGYIDRRRGVSFSSRITPTETFTSFFAEYGFDISTFKQKEDAYGGMRLRREDGKPYYYGDNEVPEWVLSSRQILSNYNTLLQETDIELRTDEDVTNIPVDTKLVYRIFNNGNTAFEDGGRFYGAWWTNCPKHLRKAIFINNEQTVELDYTANHIYLAYGLNDQDMPEELREDPYNISDGYHRKLVKFCILTAINAATSLKAFKGLLKTIRERLIDPNEDRNQWLEITNPLRDEDGKFRKVKYDQVISKVIEKHPIIEEYLHTSQGKLLQNYDSRVAEYVIKTMTSENIPCLGIHDSFIVPLGNKDRLEEVMQEAYTYLDIEKALPPITED